MAANGYVQTSVFKLGRVAFSVKDCDLSFKNELDVLLPHCIGAREDQIQDIISSDIRNLQNTIFKKHDDCLWLDAGCLIAPNGKKILIVGRSGTGKSTTTMALALAYDWKVIAEDILLIDFKKDQLITFGAPFSLKPGTFQLLRDSIGRVPDPILKGEWSPLGKMAAPSGENARFDVSIFLSRTADMPAMHVTTLSPSAYLRKCLPVSNVLRMQGTGEKLLQYVSSGKCLEIEDGNLQERLATILDLCGELVGNR